MCRKAGLLLIALSAWAQSRDSAPAFEVVAIKRGASGLGSGASLSGGIYTANNLTLVQLIVIAYGVRDQQVLGASSWMTSERYSITAKIPGEDGIPQDQQLRMLQTLLADRFALKFHSETKDVTAYALLADSGGPKLKESAPGAKTKELSGVTAANPAGGYEYTAASTAFLAARLSFYFKRFAGGTLVLDKTGFAGSYDFSLPWTRQTAPGGEGPSIFTAIHKLGLRLEKGKYPVQMISIDSAQKPAID